jgi:hypothetical protein
LYRDSTFTSVASSLESLSIITLQKVRNVRCIPRHEKH